MEAAGVQCNLAYVGVNCVGAENIGMHTHVIVRWVESVTFEYYALVIFSFKKYAITLGSDCKSNL